ncbi:hypothetical protein C3B44_02360 [Corynebacterium yudongzhengii]|uniref:DUF3017 domain-containing protein n=1 Tax=Corynebacterium yudongzhengii TaxID=2080740 RepID=A0A2U1T7A6_9CORY|nr:DUF3017 domain-containing protein [Corynebacterium yudongzhengii]AWB81335.1 hypothetical protein C3B44_02360 [Corynebacterium yudongzhengii]PWC01778.1 DUF3017 domain-containing protein [Corynebacterium yudongzhengii]
MPELSLDNPHDIGNPASRLPRWLQLAGLVAFLALIAAFFGWMLTEHWRRATFALGVAMVWLGVLRLTCDSRILGIFAVRSVKFDVAFCFAVGGLMAAAAASVDALGS